MPTKVIPTIGNMLQSGTHNFSAIARTIGISRERVRQLALKHFGITGKGLPKKQTVPGKPLTTHNFIFMLNKWLKETNNKYCRICHLIKCNDEFVPTYCRECMRLKSLKYSRSKEGKRVRQTYKYKQIIKAMKGR